MGVDEIRPYFEELIRVVEQITTGVQSPGPWCDHCAGAAKCEALTHTVYSMWSAIEGRAFLDPTGQQLADELDMLDRMGAILKARKAAVEAEAEIRIADQKLVPGWAMTDRIGKSMWKYPPEVVKMMTGIDPYEQKVVTPAELKRRGANEDTVKQITTRPRVGRKLTRVSERDIASAFGG